MKMEKVHIILLLVFTTMLVSNPTQTNGQSLHRWYTYCAPTIVGPTIGFTQNLALAYSDLTVLAGQGLVSGFMQYGLELSSDFAQALYYCREGLTTAQCQSCVVDAQLQLAACGQRTEGIVWYNECTVHVANRNMRGLLMTEPQLLLWNLDTFKTDRSLMASEQRDLVTQIFSMASQNVNGYSYGTLVISPGAAGFYVAAQCSPDLLLIDTQLCISCLLTIGKTVQLNEARVLQDTSAIAGVTPSCSFLTGYAPINAVNSTTAPNLVQPNSTSISPAAAPSP